MNWGDPEHTLINEMEECNLATSKLSYTLTENFLLKFYLKLPVYAKFLVD